MNLSENIINAFEVVSKTYENVNKLIKYCDSIANEYGYEPVTSKLLKNNSNSTYEVSLTKGIIKLFQYKNDEKLNNGWKNGSVFVMEIDFYDEPVVYLSKLDYEEISSWSSGVSLTGYWNYADPVDCNDSEFITTHVEGKDNYFMSIPATEETKIGYWNIEKVLFTKTDLLQIESSNVPQKIFGEFDILNSIQI